MGLDMYLMKYPKTNNFNIKGEEIAYWRKANQIRKWFVNHIDEFSEDSNLESYEVTKELLEQLITDCRSVLLAK